MVVMTKLTPSQAGSYDHSRMVDLVIEEAVGKARNQCLRDKGWKKHKERERHETN